MRRSFCAFCGEEVTCTGHSCRFMHSPTSSAVSASSPDREISEKSEVTRLREENAALAAALLNCNKEWTDALDSVRQEMNNGAQFENPFLAASARKALATLDDCWTPAAILAARDAAQRRAGAVAALRAEADWLKSKGQHWENQADANWLNGRADQIERGEVTV